MNEEKLKKIIEKLYINEILGKGLIGQINQYPEVIPIIEELRSTAYDYEVQRMNKKNDVSNLRKKVEGMILRLDNSIQELPNYKQSRVLFNEAGKFTGLF